MSLLALVPRHVLVGVAFAAGVASAATVTAFITPVRDFVRDWIVSDAAEEKCVAGYELEAAKEALRAEKLISAQRQSKIEELQRIAAADAEALRRFEAEVEAARERESEREAELERLAEDRPDLPRLRDLGVRLRNR